MGFQISKFPLTLTQLKSHKLPPAPKVVSVVFKKCGHPAKMFEEAAKGRTEIEGYCWGCKKN